jgi:hypothetical protein
LDAKMELLKSLTFFSAELSALCQSTATLWWGLRGAVGAWRGASSFWRADWMDKSATTNFKKAKCSWFTAFWPWKTEPSQIASKLRQKCPKMINNYKSRVWRCTIDTTQSDALTDTFKYLLSTKKHPFRQCAARKTDTDYLFTKFKWCRFTIQYKFTVVAKTKAYAHSQWEMICQGFFLNTSAQLVIF